MINKLLVAMPILIGVFATNSALAGAEGHGGIAVVCRTPTGQVRSVELLDFYETRVRHISLELGVPTLSVQQKLDIMLNRLNAHGDTMRAELYSTWAQQFFSDKFTTFLPNTTLAPTRDAYEKSFPNGCEPEQLIIQQTPQFPEDTLWTVNQDLWNKMDNNNRAGAVMHELMFREALNQSPRTATDSRRVRYFNSNLAGDRFKNITDQQYIDFITHEVNLNVATVQGIDIGLYLPKCIDKNGVEIIDDVICLNSNFQFYPNGLVNSIAYALPGTSGTVSASGQDLQITSAQLSGYKNWGDPDGVRLRDPDIIFYPDGSINRVPIEEQNFNWHGQSLDIGGIAILDKNHNLRETELKAPSDILINGEKLHLVPYGTDPYNDPAVVYLKTDLQFSAGGALVGAGTTTTQTFNGANYRLTAGDYDHFSSGDFGGHHFELFPDGGLKSLIGVSGSLKGEVMLAGSWRQICTFADDLQTNSPLYQIATFYPNGRPKVVQLNQDFQFQVQDKMLISPACGDMLFYPNGNIEWASVERGGVFSSRRDWFSLSVGGKQIRFSRYNENRMFLFIELYSDGNVKSGILYGDQTLITPDGKNVTISDNTPVVFDENGKLIKSGY